MCKKIPISIFLIVWMVSLTLVGQAHGDDGEIEPPQAHQHHHVGQESSSSSSSSSEEHHNPNAQPQHQQGNRQPQHQQGNRQPQHQQGNRQPQHQQGNRQPQHQQGNRHPHGQRGGNKQLDSSGGGFNANINQNNEFSPNFGNMGAIGSIGGRAATQGSGFNTEGGGNMKGRAASQLDSSGGGFNANINQDNNFSPTFGNMGAIGSIGGRAATQGSGFNTEGGGNMKGRAASQLDSSGGGFNANINQNNEFSPNFGNMGAIGSIGGRAATQLESSGGGFNANINQNNNFSPTFGNIGDIGSIGGRAASQLESSGGGFNANINQNNNFSPNFGNMGEIGSIGGRAFDGKASKIGSYLENLSEDDIAKFLYYGITSLVNHANSKHKVSKHPQKPEYFFDFRKIYLPTDRSDSSSSESGSSSDE